KREGYAARSVYKLQEIDRKLRLLRPGARVLDLGAYPGSWTTYAAERVGPSGRVLGVDLQLFRGTLPANAEIRQGDALALDLDDGPFDVVLSDMAPSTTGHRFTDQARSFELFMRALEIATRLLAPGGSFVGKIFQGPDFQAARKAVAEAFEEVRILKPEASRSESYEVFLAGRRMKPRAQQTDQTDHPTE
ncbi:MAG: RlmE family RNA methyltransferase, partial [Sandaracinaceae bacterium]|nr:RlmE family RNA methyltransferase [Sandaracinaceae bacterium]